MTDEERAARAAEARRFKENEAAMMAIAAIRRDALEGLAAIDATDADGIRKMQARVAAADEFTTLIETYIRSGNAVKQAGIV